jgi:hypothetical protein
MLLMAANMLWVNSSDVDAPTQDDWRAAELHEAEHEAIRKIAALRRKGSR